MSAKFGLNFALSASKEKCGNRNLCQLYISLIVNKTSFFFITKIIRMESLILCQSNTQKYSVFGLDFQPLVNGSVVSRNLKFLFRPKLSKNSPYLPLM